MGNKLHLSFNPSAEFQISNLVVTPTEMSKQAKRSPYQLESLTWADKLDRTLLPLTVNQTVEDTRTVTLDKEESIIAEFKVTKQHWESTILK